MQEYINIKIFVTTENGVTVSKDVSISAADWYHMGAEEREKSYGLVLSTVIEKANQI